MPFYVMSCLIRVLYLVVAIATLMSFDILLDTVQVNMLVSAISKA